MAESLAKALREYYADNFGITRQNDYNTFVMLNTVANSIGTFSDPEAVLVKIFEKINSEHEDFVDIRTEKQQKILVSICKWAKDEIDLPFQVFVSLLKHVFIKRLEYSEMDHKLKYAYSVAEILVETDYSSETADAVIDNLVFVFRGSQNLSIDAVIEKFQKQNVQDQEKYLMAAANYFLEQQDLEEKKICNA